MRKSGDNVWWICYKAVVLHRFRKGKQLKNEFFERFTDKQRKVVQVLYYIGNRNRQ